MADSDHNEVVVCSYCKEPIKKTDCGAWQPNNYTLWDPPEEWGHNMAQTVYLSEAEMLSMQRYKLLRSLELSEEREALHLNCIQERTQTLLRKRMNELDHKLKENIEKIVKKHKWDSPF